MRFAISRVIDTIESRLTTDVTLAQAVVDAEEVIRYVDLDGGRSINLLRLGMAVDALVRYLIDEGAMLYPVVRRQLLSEADLTSKERMVLGRWADDGAIEVVATSDNRAIEIADLTGLPFITVSNFSRYLSLYPWMRSSPERILKLRPRNGYAVLIPGAQEVVRNAATVVVGRATVDSDKASENPDVSSETDETPAIADEPAVTSAETPDQGDEGSPESRESSAEVVEDHSESDRPSSEQGQPGASEMERVEAFVTRGVMRVSHTLVTRERVIRAEPSGVGLSLLARQWRCPELECSVFGDYRRIGQPIPHMRDGAPACPRHGTLLIDVGPRPSSYVMAVVVNDIAKRRFVVTEGVELVVGRGKKEHIDVNLSEWLYSEAARWVSSEHARIRLDKNVVIVRDTSRNGTVIWKRSSVDDKGRAVRIKGTEHQLGRWDSIEPYTGVEIVIAGQRGVSPVSVHSEPRSVLIDAPTVALRRQGAI